MKKKVLQFWVLFFASGLFLFLPVFAASDFKQPLPEVETLPNGLKVAWFVNDHLPLIDLNLWVQAGFKDDPVGKSGTAELVASLLERGSDASHSAVASDDTFSVTAHGLAPDANALMESLAHRVIAPDFTPADVEREKKRLLDRWNHVEDYNEALVALVYRRMITSGTRYGRGSLISAREVNQLSHKDVADYHKKYFTPKNSILGVIGRVDKESFRLKLLHSLFGSWGDSSGQSQPQIGLKREHRIYSDLRLVPKRQSVLVINHPSQAQAQVRVGCRVPGMTSPDLYSWIVANAVLGEVFSSRLNTSVRDKLGLTYSIGSTLTYNPDLAELSISCGTRNEAVGKLIQKISEVLKNFKSGPFTVQEVDAAKNYLMGEFPLVNASMNALAGRWFTGLVFGMGPDYLNEFIPKIRRVSAQEVEAAVKRGLNLDSLTIVVAGTGEVIQKSLQSAGFHSIKQVSVSELK